MTTAAQLIRQLDLPDSKPVAGAVELVTSVSDPWMVNHVARSFAFARVLAPRRIDLEVLAVGSLLHDIALDHHAVDDGRFEADGADMARELVLESGFDERRADLVWDAIALHSSIGLAERHPEPAVRLVFVGAWLDAGGRGAERLPDGAAEAIFGMFPRLGMREHAAESFKRHLLEKSERRAPPFTLQASAAEVYVPGFVTPTFAQLAAAPDPWPSIPD